ncbi:uncharacterized protein LOC133533774 [Cydia pomonella]|uniref:uncharacterized protein LOC133533774 n=1 Tax=Cydia pomonella TaxID=82600 RepID=UPI002ADDC570|nr:uncharacterized protein LOC133533774 [Cydia pomonella]
MASGLNRAGKVLIYEKGAKPRACIVFNKNINFLPVTELCSEDQVAAYVDLKGRGALKVIVCSAYLPGEKQDPTEELTKVLEYAQAQKAELIVGCDANAHHTIWGSTNALANSNKVILRWVPGHSDIIGNEEADELARKGADTPLVGPEPFCGITKRDAYSLLSNLEKTRAIDWWKFVKGQEHSKALIKGFNNKFAKELLELKRHKTCAVTRILTGHCKLNKHMFQIGKKQDATCRFCHESEETAMHILCSCGPLMSKRSTHLGRHVLQPYEVQNITAQRIWNFLDSTGISNEL